MIENQAYVFLWTVIIGMVLGLVFDLFRIMRRKGNTKDIVVYLQDIVFWIIVTVIVIISTFLINDGDLRGYMIIGYILGGTFYIFLFSKTIRMCLTYILDFFEGIAKELCKRLVAVVENKKFFKKIEK